VEEGMKKGPQSIEKAKQGAYDRTVFLSDKGSLKELLTLHRKDWKKIYGP